MKAVVKYETGPQGVRLMDMPKPVPGPGEILVRVLACGICGSDIHALHDSGDRKVNMPCILGHEFVGEIEETGEGDVCGLTRGDWVTALPACYGCGTCRFCKAGLVTLCPERKSVGTHRNGAMAEYIVVPARFAFRLPPSAVSAEDKKLYALAEPFCCMVRGIYERITVREGDTVMLSGPGPMGMMALQLFKAKGAYVIVSGLPQDKERLRLCKALGADEVYDDFELVKEAVYRRNPYGADITCDVAAVSASINSCFDVIGTHGTHLQIGICGKNVSLNIDRLFAKEAVFVPTNSTAVSSWKIGMRLLEDKTVDLRPLMDLEVSIDEWRRGFDAVIEKTAYKVLILP